MAQLPLAEENRMLRAALLAPALLSACATSTAEPLAESGRRSQLRCWASGSLWTVRK